MCQLRTAFFSPSLLPNSWQSTLKSLSELLKGENSKFNFWASTKDENEKRFGENKDRMKELKEKLFYSDKPAEL